MLLATKILVTSPTCSGHCWARRASSSSFRAHQTRRAEGFAGNASGALALRLASYAALTDQLRSSLASRTVIDQALGVIMAQERCTHSRAFAILRAASQNRNVKLRHIAAAVVMGVSGEPPQPPQFEGG
jgi:tryptophan 2,3-dioxygenase